MILHLLHSGTEGFLGTMESGTCLPSSPCSSCSPHTSLPTPILPGHHIPPSDHALPSCSDSPHFYCLQMTSSLPGLRLMDWLIIPSSSHCMPHRALSCTTPLDFCWWLFTCPQHSTAIYAIPELWCPSTLAEILPLVAIPAQHNLLLWTLQAVFSSLSPLSLSTFYYRYCCTCLLSPATQEHIWSRNHALIIFSTNKVLNT